MSAAGLCGCFPKVFHHCAAKPEGEKMNALKSGQKKKGKKQQLDINMGVDEGGRHFTTRFSLTVVYLGLRKDQRAPS